LTTQFKTKGESLNALSKINNIVNNDTVLPVEALNELSSASKEYSVEALKMAIAQTKLDESQIEAILSTKNLKGEILESTTAELAQITATNQTAAAQAGATVSTNVFSASLKKLGLALKGLVASHPVLTAMAGIAVAAFAAVKIFDALTESNEEYIAKQQKIVDTAKENIKNYDDEISSLESLQEKLKEAKNNKEELAKIQGDLNNSIGYTPGLLNNESGAYDIANQKIKDRIARLKELKQEELNKKITAQKNIFNNREIDNGWGVDHKLSHYSKQKIHKEDYKFLQVIFGEYLGDLDSESLTLQEIYDILKKNGFGTDNKDGYPNMSDSEIWSYLINVANNDSILGLPSAQEMQEYFDEQTQNVQKIFKDSGIFEDSESIFSTEELNAMIQSLVEGGYASDLEGIQQALEALMNNSELSGLINQYYESLFDESVDSDALYSQIKTQFDELENQYPMLKGILENFYNNMGKDVENASMINSNSTLFDSIKLLKENMDSLTSSTSSLSSALATLYSGDYNSSDLLSSISAINSAISEFGDKVSIDWEHISSVDELQNELLKISEAYADSMMAKSGINDSAFSKVIKNSIIETVKLKAQLDGVNSAFDSLQNNYKTLNDTITAYNENGYITVDQLQSLLNMDSKYLACLTDQNGALSLNQTAYANLTKIQIENAKAAALTKYESEIARIKQDALARSNKELSDGIGSESDGLIEKLNSLAERFTILSGTVSFTKKILSKIKNVKDDLKSQAEIEAENNYIDEQAKKELEEAKKVYDTSLQLIHQTGAAADKSMDEIFGNKKDSDSSPADSASVAADTTFNWIETRISRLQRRFQNMVDSVTGYVSSHFKLNKMEEELRSLDEQISAYQSAEALYFQKAYNIPLDEGFRQKVINGEISVQTLSNESLVNAVNEFKEWYEKYLDAVDQKVKLTNDRQAKIREKMDLQAAFHQTRQNRLSAAADRFNDTIDNKTSRGKYVTPAYYRHLIQNAEQQIAEYTAEKNLWQNYLSTLEETSDEYEGVMDSIEGIDSSIRSCIADQLEWKKTIAETSYNRLVSKYEALETKSGSRTGKIEYLESIGSFGSKSDYNALIRLNGKQIQNLYAQNAELEQLRNNCDAGTDLWKEYTKNIQDNNSSVLDLTRSTAEYADTLYHLPIEKAAAKTERLQKDFELLEKKMEYADSYVSKNKYLDKENSNEYGQLTAYREASAAAGKSFYGKRSNLLKQIDFQSLNGNDIRILRQCINNGTAIPASIIAKMDASSAARANKYNASLKAKNEADLNYESYRYDYIKNKKSRGEQKLEHINNHYETELTKWTDEATLYNAKISLKEKLGVTQSRTDYNRLIANSKKQEHLLEHQRSAIYAQIQKNLTSGVWSYDSEEYKKAKSALYGIDENILKAKTDQQEWNNAIRSIPVNTIEKLSSVLNLVKSRLEGLMDLAEKHGNTVSPSALKKLIYQSVSVADQARESIELYTEMINKKLTGGDWAKLTEKQLAKVWKYIEAGDISRLKNYFTYTLNIDPATLEEFFSDIDKIADETDKKFQAEIQAEEYLDRFFDLYIDKLNKVKEKLNEINDARQKALELEKLEAGLQKAKDNKTISIYREGVGMVYEADQAAIKEAQDNLDDFYYEQMIDHLDKISDILEELKETFNIYTDNGTLKADYESIIADALTSAADLYAKGLQSLGGNSGSFDLYKNLMQSGGLPEILLEQNLADMKNRMKDNISAVSSASGNKITNISLKLDNVSLPNIKNGQDAEKFIQELKRISLDAQQFVNKK